MKIKKYIFEIIKKIQRINLYVSNPKNYEEIDNPFIHVLPKTYVWFDNENIK